MAADPYSFALLSNHDPYHPIPITSERNGQHIEPRAYYHTHHLLHHQTVSASCCAIHSHVHDPNFSQATDTTPQDSRSRNSLGNLTCKPRRSLAFLTFRTRQARPALHGNDSTDATVQTYVRAPPSGTTAGKTPDVSGLTNFPRFGGREESSLTERDILVTGRSACPIGLGRHKCL